MAKNLLLSVLLEYISLYVEEDSLVRENLKFGVFSGRIELQNLKIKQHALQTITGISLSSSLNIFPPHMFCSVRAAFFGGERDCEFYSD